MTALLTAPPARPSPAVPAPVPAWRRRQQGLTAVRPFPVWGTTAWALGAVVLSVVAAAVGGTALGVAAAAAAAAGYALAVRPTLLVLVAVAVVPVSAGLLRGFPVPGLRLSEVLIVLTAVVVIGLRGLEPGPRWTLVDWLGLTYVALTIGLSLYNVVVVRGVAFELEMTQQMLGPVQFFLLYRCVVVQLRTATARRAAITCLLVASVPVSVLAVLQIVGPEAVHEGLIAITGTDIYDFEGFVPDRRASSVFQNWHSLAAYESLISLITLALLLERRRGPALSIALLLLLGLSLTALAMTLTITGVLMVTLGGLALGLWYRRFVLLGVLAAAGVAVLLSPYAAPFLERLDSGTSVVASRRTWLPPTLADRLNIWTENYIPLLGQYLLTGFGPDLPESAVWRSTESGYITLLLRGGVPLLAAMVALVAAACVLGRVLQARSTGLDRALGRVVVVLGLLLPVGNLIWPYVTASGLPLVMWPLWGLVVAATSTAATSVAGAGDDAPPAGVDAAGVGAAGAGAGRA